MPVITPPPPRIDERELEELVDELRALIEEARRRARRRRRFVAAVVAAALAAGAAALYYGAGDATLGRSSADASSLPAATQSPPHAWGASYGPDGAFVVSFASAPDALYAGTIGSGIFRSGDGGRSWHALTAGLPAALRVDALAVDPVHSATVYAGTAEGVFRSVDAGRSWHRASRGLFRERPSDSRRHRLVEGYVGGLAIDPQHPSTVYASAGDRAYRSDDAGHSWRPDALPGDWVMSRLEFARREPVVIAMVSVGGDTRVAKSADRGRTWTLLGLRLPRLGTGSAVIDPGDARTFYLPVGYRGLLKSSDGGLTWRRVYEHRVVALALAEGTVYLSTGTGLVVSGDGGATWRPLSLGLRQDESAWQVWSNRYHDQAVYAATAGRLLRSVDGGATWTEAVHGFRASGVPRLSVAGNRLYAAGESGLFRSDDAGLRWRTLEPGATPTAVAADPAHPHTVYVGTPLSGAFRSDDDGRTWRAASDGLAGRRISALAFDGRGTLYAATLGAGIFARPNAGPWEPTPVTARTFALAVTGGTVYGGTGNGAVWRTDDGASWARRGHVCCGRVNALAADPADRDVVYAGNSFGISRSSDGGGAWRRVGPAGVQVQALAVDPRDSRIVYAGTWGGAGVYRSTDTGLTWRPFAAGLPPGAVGGTSFAAGVGALAVSADGRWLFAGTLGNGVVRRSLAR